MRNREVNSKLSGVYLDFIGYKIVSESVCRYDEYPKIDYDEFSLPFSSLHGGILEITSDTY